MNNQQPFNLHEFYRNALLAKDNEELIDILASHSRIVHKDKREIVFAPGVGSDTAIILLDGVLKTYIVSPNGTEHTHSFHYQTGSIICLTDEMINSPGIWCETLIETTYIEFTDLNPYKLTEEYPVLYSQFLQRYIAFYFGTMDKLCASYTMTAKERYLWFMKKYAPIADIIPQVEVAQFIGIAPASLSRIRSELLEEGITPPGFYLIKALKSLPTARIICGSNPIQSFYKLWIEKEKCMLTGYPTIDRPWTNYYPEEAQELNPPTLSLYELIKEKNKDYLDGTALSYFDKSFTFKELFKKIELVAGALTEQGIKPGDIVSICSISTPEVVCLFYALNKIGAVANMLDPRNNKDYISQVLKDTQCKLLFVLDVVSPKLEEDIQKYPTVLLSVSESMPLVTKSIYRLKNKSAKVTSAMTWKEFVVSGNGKTVPDIPFEPNRPTAIVYTGGTTGVPKGAILSNENMNTLALEYKYCLPKAKRGQTILIIMPPFIAYGLTIGMHTPLTLGVKAVIIPKFDPKKFPDLIVKYKPEHTVGIPSHYEEVIKSPKLKGVDLSHWYTPGSGGDAINETLEKSVNAFLKKHNCDASLMIGYGMTELCSSAATNLAHFAKVGTVGFPLPKNTIGVFTPGTDEELPFNTDGEICVTGPTVFLGYLNNPEEEAIVKKKHKDGKIWIHSQDFGFMDEDGFITIKGRIKRMITRPDGHNNFPSELEKVIACCNGVENVAVISIPGKRYGNGDIPIAAVVRKPDSTVSADEILSYSMQNSPAREAPCHVFFVDQLPLTNIGKVDFRTLEKQFEDMTASTPEIMDSVYSFYEKTMEMH